MDDDIDSFGVHAINSPESIKGLGRPSRDGKEKRHEQQQSPLKKDAREFFHALSKAAESTNEVLTKKGLPYRVRFYLDDDEVFIDLLVLDEKGGVVEEKRKNISRQDFARLIEDVSNIEGMFFDKEA